MKTCSFDNVRLKVLVPVIQFLPQVRKWNTSCFIPQ